jgi:hypothetical protein
LAELARAVSAHLDDDLPELGPEKFTIVGTPSVSGLPRWDELLTRVESNSAPASLQIANGHPSLKADQEYIVNEYLDQTEPANVVFPADAPNGKKFRNLFWFLFAICLLSIAAVWWYSPFSLVFLDETLPLPPQASSSSLPQAAPMPANLPKTAATGQDKAPRVSEGETGDVDRPPTRTLTRPNKKGDNTSDVADKNTGQNSGFITINATPWPM